MLSMRRPSWVVAVNDGAASPTARRVVRAGEVTVSSSPDEGCGAGVVAADGALGAGAGAGAVGAGSGVTVAGAGVEREHATSERARAMRVRFMRRVLMLRCARDGSVLQGFLSF